MSRSLDWQLMRNWLALLVVGVFALAFAFALTFAITTPSLNEQQFERPREPPPPPPTTTTPASLCR